VNTGITVTRLKSPFQPNNKLPSIAVRNPPCRSDRTSRPVYAVYWEKLEVSGRDSVGGAVVISCRETEKTHKFSRYIPSLLELTL
jgi:hypothetical protein